MKVKPVIMAGGLGTRLWPLSRQMQPKQFIKIFKNLSSIQKTLITNRTLGKPTLIIAKEYELIAKEQLRELNIEADLIIEPMPKNTASCAIISAIQAKNNGYDTVILLPSDHYIHDIDKYLITINESLNYVAKFGICTIGIKPSFANTEYGYIKINKLLADRTYNTQQFVEKPTLQQAQNYLTNGKYFWNSGIFIFNIDFILEQAKLWQKELFKHVYDAYYFATKDHNNITLALEPYLYITPISLDYAIIENISQMIMIEANFSWNDIGNWHSLWQIQKEDITNNYCEGDVINIDSTNSYISSNNKLTAVIGVDNIIIINTEDALLIVNKSRVEKIKQLVMEMTEMGRKEVL
ncbi:mannose-1-phosphate guanylyltransferase [Candidatus Tisiphia endosymbiont of Metellina segmentata]|uniref:mannose-1-phosphate guanylyltransferase n=1 Tax=Candidatus Tisiphia endosymbiont of Metellina segmentata TaxID=3066274 RepID=UPI00313C0D9A